MAQRIRALLGEAAKDAARRTAVAEREAEAKVNRVSADADRRAADRIESIIAGCHELLEHARQAHRHTEAMAARLVRVMAELREEDSTDGLEAGPDEETGTGSAGSPSVGPAKGGWPTPSGGTQPAVTAAADAAGGRVGSPGSPGNRRSRWLSWLPGGREEPAPSGEDPAAGEPSPAAETTGRIGSGNAGPPGSEEEKALRMAIRLAIEGRSRKQIAATLAGEHGIEDTGPILDRIFDDS